MAALDAERYLAAKGHWFIKKSSAQRTAFSFNNLMKWKPLGLYPWL
jgi:hypothetical protein